MSPESNQHQIDPQRFDERSANRLPSPFPDSVSMRKRPREVRDNLIVFTVGFVLVVVNDLLQIFIARASLFR